MTKAKVAKAIVEEYIMAWLSWQGTKDPESKIRYGGMMNAAILISKRLDVPAVMFADARARACGHTPQANEKPKTRHKSGKKAQKSQEGKA